MRQNPKIISFLLIAFLFLLIQGCAHTSCDRFVHDPPLAQNVNKLVRGKTTGTEVLSIFGTPDFEVAGADVTVNSNSTMAQQRAAMKSRCQKWKRLIEKNQYKSSLASSLPKCDPEYCDESARLLAYSSIDEDHIAYLYFETSLRQRTSLYFFGLPGGNIKWRNDVRINRLFILVEKHSGLVDEFAFREEFKADD